MSRVLLLELAAVDRFHRAVVFPYLLGFLRAKGVDARWLRFGVAAANQAERGEVGVGLDAGDLERLRHELTGFEPTAVVVSMTPASSLRLALSESAPDAAVEVLGETLAEVRSAWAGLIGEAHAARGVPYWAEVVPDFGFVAANVAAETMQPLPFIVLGAECTYDRPLASNPFYDGVDLTGAVRRGGCAFCSRRENTGKEHRFAAETPGRQLRALAATLPSFEHGRLAIRFQGEQCLAHIEELARLCVAEELPPADLLFDCRASRLVRRRATLTAACDQLRGSGHRLHMALVGIESFSRAELSRLNKGTSPLVNLDAISTLLELEAEQEGRFRFREHGGLSLIMFTPWTTLDDLALNLCLVRDCGLEEMCGKLFTSRLRLEEGLPITALARAESLLIDSYSDPCFDTAARNLYARELPWRFVDPQLEPVCAILLRLDRDMRAADGERDALTERVERVLTAAAGRGWSALDVAIYITERARARQLEQAGVVDADELLDALDAFCGTAPVSCPEARTDWEGPSGPAVTAIAGLARARLKPVAKIAPVRLDDTDDYVQHLQSDLEVRVRVLPGEGGPRTAEVFLGTEAAEVERAVELARLCAEAPGPEAEAAATAEIGELLGYPRCCAEAFARGESQVLRESYPWLQLARRMEVPGFVPATMNPWCSFWATQYVPCSLDCAESHEKANRAVEVVNGLSGLDGVQLSQEPAVHPWLALLGKQGCALELVPLEPPGGAGFRFRTGKLNGPAWELELAASRADQLVLDGERLLLLCDGRELLDLTARAFVWWHEQAFQTELWTRVLAIRAYRQRSARDDAEGRPDVGELGLRLKRALTELAERGAKYGDSAAWHVEAAGPGRLLLRLGEGEGLVELSVTASAVGGDRLFQLGSFAFSYPRERPLATVDHVAVVRDFARLLGLYLRRGDADVGH